MKKIDLGQSVTILANVGVLIGVLLLVYELSQNRAMMEAQTLLAVNQGFAQWTYNVSADLETTDMMARGNRGEELTGPERARYAYLVSAQLRNYENSYNLYRIGLLDEESFSVQRLSWRDRNFSRLGIRRFYCQNRPILAPDFVMEIDALLPEPCVQ